MTGVMIACLIIAVVLLGMAFCVMLPWMHTLVHVNRTLAERTTDHHDCVNKMAHAVSGQFAAVVLNDAADRWDTVENMKHLERLRREWQPGQQGVAAHWMREQAGLWLDPAWVKARK